MNGNVYTNGPLYRPEPGAPVRDYQPPAMPPRYQARRMQIEQTTGINPIPEHSGLDKHLKAETPPVVAQPRVAARTARKDSPQPQDRGSRRSAGSVTQKIIARIKAAEGWVDAADLMALEPKMDHKKLKNLLHRYRSHGQVVVRRRSNGVGFEYCWGPTARAAEPKLAQASGRGMTENSLTFWICAVLREDRERWMSTEEMAHAIAEATTVIDRPAPAVVSNRLSPLLRSGRLEKRPREGARHGHGSTMEYRLATAF